MTPKIEAFLRTRQPATPCLVLDLDVVAQNFQAMRTALPDAHIYYAVKANPAPPILRRLAALGACFDAASWEEIEMCLAAGAPPARISFGNTIKKASAVAAAAKAGIDLFVFDCAAELEKIARHAPGARVFCRLAVGAAGSVFPLTRKFGASAELAVVLMARARSLGLVAYGVSFHVGSQQTRSETYEAAIGQAALLFAELEKFGIALRMIDIGGGFPAHYDSEIPPIARFADGISAAMRRHFGNHLPEMLVEPGRFMVGGAGLVCTEVVLVSRRDGARDMRWVYLDIGKFGGLSETEGELTRYVIRTPHDGGPDAPAILAGPTCDSADILYEKTPYRLPLALAEGDRIEILAAGAYVSTYASTGFNGFRPLEEHYV